jgi:hypothetical protein
MRPWYKIHFSTLFVLAIVLVVLIFVNVPGEQTSIVSDRFYHGWPYHYFDREGTPHSFWSFAGTAPHFHGEALLLNVLTAFCLVGLTACACELWIRRNGRLLRFGTRSLIVVTALVAVLVSLVARDVRRSSRQQQALEELAQFGSLETSRDLQKFDWFRSLFGDQFHGSIRRVLLTADRPVHRLSDLSGLETVEGFGLYVPNLPENFEQLSRLPNLKYLSVTLTSAAAADRARLTALTQLPQLYSLGLLGDRVVDEDILQISQESRLEAISIGSSKITAKALRHLSELKSLTSLTLDQNVAQNQDCSVLLQFPGLSYLNFIGNNITQQDADKMRSLWPDAMVIGGTSAIATNSTIWKPSLRIFREGSWLNSP